MKTLLLCLVLIFVVGCNIQPSSDEIQRQQQERILQEGTSQIGMPSIKNFREKKLLKDIYELRDQDGLVTYTYLVSEMTNKKTLLCQSIGFAFPYATEYTSPQKVDYFGSGHIAVPQADPNGLFAPSAAEGTWVMCKDPNGTETRPVYVEPRIIVSPFKLNE